MVRKKPYLPVFVGSTFEDMQLYRRSVKDALTQLEAIVRGMEQFGSKPGRPIEECLRAVESCKIYIGIFGMRYGSVPEGYDRSMTHLEYDEAQKLDLPSLVYIIDEENQPILPKYVETGPGAQKLRELKEQLKKRHTVSFFTTPDDMRARILHDVPQLLKELGEIHGNVKLPEPQGDAEILKQFIKLPKLFSGRQVNIDFVNDVDFRTAYEGECLALGLEIGASVGARAKIGTDDDFYIFAERDIALALCGITKKIKVHAKAVTAFGVYRHVEWTDDGPVVNTEVETGLILKEITNPETDSRE